MRATPARAETEKEASVSARFLHQLVSEREPSLDQLLRERNAWPELYEPLSVMLENNVRGLVGHWHDE